MTRAHFNFWILFSALLLLYHFFYHPFRDWLLSFASGSWGALLGVALAAAFGDYRMLVKEPIIILIAAVFAYLTALTSTPKLGFDAGFYCIIGAISLVIWRDEKK